MPAKCERITVQCVICGKSKEVTEYYYNKNTTGNFFCDGKCWGKYKERQVGKDNPGYRRIEKECKFCGKIYEVKRYEKDSSKFCSRECHSKWKSENLRGEKSYAWKGGPVTLNCSGCGKEIIKPRALASYHKDNVCSDECKRKVASIKFSGENNPNYKGFFYRNLASFEHYGPLLKDVEKVRENPSDPGVLQVTCTYCGRWISPTFSETTRRLSAINSINKGENRFYCNDGSNCKDECSIYKRYKYPKGFKPATSREVSTFVRKQVLLEDDYTCQKCNSKNNLQVHHIISINNSVMEQHDKLNCITLCKECHKEIHTQDECKYNQLRCKSDLLEITH